MASVELLENLLVCLTFITVSASAAGLGTFSVFVDVQFSRVLFCGTWVGTQE